MIADFKAFDVLSADINDKIHIRPEFFRCRNVKESCDAEERSLVWNEKSGKQQQTDEAERNPPHSAPPSRDSREKRKRNPAPAEKETDMKRSGNTKP